MLSCPKVETPPAEPDSGPAQTSEAGEARTPTWTKPALVAYGDVRQLTMGPSPDVGESGNPALRA